MKLTHWAKAGKDRVYVRGFAWGEKAFVELRRRKLYADVDGMFAPELLEAVLKACGVQHSEDDASTYAQIRAFAQAGTPAPAPGRAAFSPGRFVGHASAAPRGQDLAFHNIQNELEVEVEVDHREPVEIDTLIAQAPKTKVTRTHLPLGDYRINGHILVERKTTRDFALSVQSSHLFDQAQRMSFDQETMGVVLIEGDVFGDPIGMLDSQITGAISCLSNVQGMSVFQTRSLEHTAYVLAKFAQHDRNGLGYHLSLRTKKPSALLDMQRYVLEGLPGINSGMADRLLARFGSVRAVLNATPEELRKVHGMGPKRAQALHDLLTAELAPAPALNE